MKSVLCMEFGSIEKNGCNTSSTSLTERGKGRCSKYTSSVLMVLRADLSRGYTGQKYY